MNDLRPQLVIDRDSRELCMQIVLGPYTATKTLPDGFGKWSDADQNDYIEALVPVMVQGLQERQRDDARKFRRRLD